MNQSLFITGGSGYLGRYFLKALDVDMYDKIVLLDRSGTLAHKAGFAVHAGDLLDPGSYENVIEEGATVIHMAALTGKGRRAEHFLMNKVATERLLGAAIRKGARRFLFLSSIAVEFAVRPGYHYADAKLAAEQAVQSSGIDHLIVRPTMIFGPEAPVMQGLSKLATAPLVPLFGGGSHQCQPVHVQDMARWLVFALRSLAFDNSIYSVAGPEALSLKNLLRMIRKKETGKDGGFLNWPLAPTRFLLRLIESPLMKFMPLTSGQLATFANDSTAALMAQEQGGHFLKTPITEMI